MRLFAYLFLLVSITGNAQAGMLMYSGTAKVRANSASADVWGIGTSFVDAQFSLLVSDAGVTTTTDSFGNVISLNNGAMLGGTVNIGGKLGAIVAATGYGLVQVRDDYLMRDSVVRDTSAWIFDVSVNGVVDRLAFTYYLGQSTYILNAGTAPPPLFSATSTRTVETLAYSNANYRSLTSSSIDTLSGIVSVPEPTSLLLFGMGVVGMCCTRLRQHQAY